MTTVLVTDDSAVDRRLLGELLEGRSGCTVEYATDGVEALARVQESRPDLIVTDLRMPRMDGLDHAAMTDVGLRRLDNRDSPATVLASDQESWQERGHLLVVGDGT